MQNENQHPHNTPNEDPQMGADEKRAHGLNTDDSVSGSDLPGFEGPDQYGNSEKLQQELDESKDKHLRLAAEFDNYKRRTAKERMEQMMTAGKDVIMDLIPVLDDFDRAEKALAESTDVTALKAGLEMVFGKLRNTLQQRGLEKMDGKGEDFNADFQEAITEVPAGEEMSGKVVEVIEPGYTLNEKIIRHAKVVVGQ